jgi:hypothetical protein
MIEMIFSFETSIYFQRTDIASQKIALFNTVRDATAHRARNNLQGILGNLKKKSKVMKEQYLKVH